MWCSRQPLGRQSQHRKKVASQMQFPGPGAWTHHCRRDYRVMQESQTPPGTPPPLVVTLFTLHRSHTEPRDALSPGRPSGLHSRCSFALETISLASLPVCFTPLSCVSDTSAALNHPGQVTVTRPRGCSPARSTFSVQGAPPTLYPKGSSGCCSC